MAVGPQGPEHCDRQSEGHDEGNGNIEVLAHHARVLFTEIKRNKWL